MTLQSQFAATLIDELFRAGVRHAVVSPGSRSSPLAIALLSDHRITAHVRLDERSGCFFAIGCALGSGSPTLVVTTSGTAAAELHPGVAEADLARVPLIVATADRPPEMYRVGAAQTIVQHGLYGGSVRYAADPGIPDEGNRPYWRSLAARLVAEATGSPNGPGPVHVNLPFREPLTGPVGDLPEPAPGGGSWHASTRSVALDERSLELFVAALRGARRGVFLLGAGAFERDPGAIVDLAEALGWPILADARGIPREPFEPLVVHSDGIVRSPSATGSLLPDLVVRVGSPHAGRPMESWLAALVARGVPQLLVDPYGRFEEPSRAPGPVLHADPPALFRRAVAEVTGKPAGEWLARWRAADDAAEAAIAELLGRSDRLTEPGIARRLVASAPQGATLFASSSMPIRDLEWFAGRRPHAPRLLANRGANGIDGVTSTILGVAATTPGPVIGMIGDLAFLHDLSGLVWGEMEVMPAATLVLVDNAGGGIFNFLAYPNQLTPVTFERAFGTPQRTDLVALAGAFGIPVTEVGRDRELAAAVEDATGSDRLSIVLARTERRANVALHDELNAAIVAAVEALS